MLLFLDESVKIFGGKFKATTDLRGEVVVLIEAAVRAAAATVGGDDLSVHDSRGRREKRGRAVRGDSCKNAGKKKYRIVSKNENTVGLLQATHG